MTSQAGRSKGVNRNIGPSIYSEIIVLSISVKYFNNCNDIAILFSSVLDLRNLPLPLEKGIMYLAIRDDVKIQLPRPSVYRSQFPPAATEG